MRGLVSWANRLPNVDVADHKVGVQGQDDEVGGKKVRMLS